MSFEQRGVERGRRTDGRSTEGSVRRGVEKGGAIKLHIERLMLHGFSPADRHQIADQVQGELLRLLREEGGLQAVKNSISVERVEAESFPHSVHASAQTSGERIAQAVYIGLRTSAAAPHGLSRMRTGVAGRGGKR